MKTNHRFSTLTVVLGTKLRSPPNEVRLRSAALDEKATPHVIGSAIAIETKGLAAIAARTFLVAYSLISKHASPFQSFGTAEAAIDFLRALPGQNDDVRNDKSLAAEVRALCARQLAPLGVAAR